MKGFKATTYTARRRCHGCRVNVKGYYTLEWVVNTGPVLAFNSRFYGHAAQVRVAISLD